MLFQELNLLFCFSVFIITFLSFLEHFSNTFETTLTCTLVVPWTFIYYHRTQTGSITTVTSKMEHFRTIFDSFYSVTVPTKGSILNVVNNLDRTLITSIFASQGCILINLKPMHGFTISFPFCKLHSFYYKTQ